MDCLFNRLLDPSRLMENHANFGGSRHQKIKDCYKTETFCPTLTIYTNPPLFFATGNSEEEEGLDLSLTQLALFFTNTIMVNGQKQP